MSWLSLESSVESSQPREGIEVITPSTTWRLASGSRDVTINSQRFRAEPCARDAVGVFAADKPSELIVRLPMSHAFSQRYFSQLPPRVTLINVYRAQGSESRRIWQGKVVDGGIDGHIASFTTISTFEAALQRRLPVLSVSQRCAHILYSSGCRVNRADFTVTTTVANIDGPTITVASFGGNPDQWFQHGELVAVSGAAAGERMSISNQVGAVLSCQFAIPGLADGDVVQIAAGCAHSIAACGPAKFDNVLNFLGAPHKPAGNVFIPNGLGIYQSE